MSAEKGAPQWMRVGIAYKIGRVECDVIEAFALNWLEQVSFAYVGESIAFCGGTRGCPLRGDETGS